MLNIEGFPKRLRMVIGEKSQSKFSRDIGVAPAQLTRYLNGQIPDPKLLVRISEVGGVSVDWLLRGEEHDNIRGVAEKLAAYDILPLLEDWESLDDDIKSIIKSSAKLKDLEDAKMIKRILDLALRKHEHDKVKATSALKKKKK